MDNNDFVQSNLHKAEIRLSLSYNDCVQRLTVGLFELRELQQVDEDPAITYGTLFIPTHTQS